MSYHTRCLCYAFSLLSSLTAHMMLTSLSRAVNVFKSKYACKSQQDFGLTLCLINFSDSPYNFPPVNGSHLSAHLVPKSFLLLAFMGMCKLAKCPHDGSSGPSRKVRGRSACPSLHSWAQADRKHNSAFPWYCALPWRVQKHVRTQTKVVIKACQNTNKRFYQRLSLKPEIYGNFCNLPRLNT